MTVWYGVNFCPMRTNQRQPTPQFNVGPGSFFGHERTIAC